MFENILLAYDNSEYTQRAAYYADELARQQPQPWLRVVTVVDPVSSTVELGNINLNQLIAERKIAGEAALSESIKLIGEGVEISTAVLFGDTAEVIANVAETRQCDLIVMGSRGLGAISTLLLGSKTQKVISLVNCPVLVVKKITAQQLCLDNIALGEKVGHDDGSDKYIQNSHCSGDR
jgi:nucleotide-binding universal stress UspA family protein